MSEELLRIILLAMLTLVSILLLRIWKSDLVPLLRMGAIVLTGGLLLSSLSPFVSFLKELAGTSGVSAHAVYVFRALGVALLSQCCADLSRECGESGIASLVELAGKVEILWLSLPLIREILTTAQSLLAVGG